jgi:hypothetical protein
MFENCKAYNRPDSKLYRDGVRLQKVMHSRLEELYEEADIVPPAAAAAGGGAAVATGTGAGAAAAVDDLKKSPKDPREPLRYQLFPHTQKSSDLYHWMKLALKETDSLRVNKTLEMLDLFRDCL